MLRKVVVVVYSVNLKISFGFEALVLKIWGRAVGFTRIILSVEIVIGVVSSRGVPMCGPYFITSFLSAVFAYFEP